MPIKNILTVVLCFGVFVGCSVDDLTSSGSGSSSPELASQPAEGAEAATAADASSAESSAPEETATPAETPAEAPAETVVAAAEPEVVAPPPPPESSGDCGAGHYAFHTDDDGKFHFDAHFEPGGNIRYNFSVQPNRGNWRVSGNQMIFNGPFGAGASNHVSSWTITSRASDCTVQAFQGKSYGQADVTASRY